MLIAGVHAEEDQETHACVPASDPPHLGNPPDLPGFSYSPTISAGGPSYFPLPPLSHGRGMLARGTLDHGAFVAMPLAETFPQTPDSPFIAAKFRPVAFFPVLYCG